MTKFRPDLVHVAGGPVRFLRACDRHITSAPWVFTAHNVPPAEHMFRRFYANAGVHYAVRNTLMLPKAWLWSRYLKTARFRAAFCHSQTVAGRLRKAGCPADKICEVPFGNELPESVLQPDPAEVSPFPKDAWPKILTVAGMAFPKGVLDAVRMAALLRADFPKMSYCLIGTTRDKHYRAYVDREIQSLGLSRQFQMLRTAPEQSKFAALRDADLYVQPSHEEGFCIAFLEAAMLVPRLIGTDTGVMAAIAEGDSTARIVNPGNPAALAQAATELLRKEVQESAIQTRRDRLNQRFSRAAYLDGHLETYRRVLGTCE